MLRTLLGLLFAAVLSSAATAQSCNPPSGWLVQHGPVSIGNSAIYGPDCGQLQDGGTPLTIGNKTVVGNYTVQTTDCPIGQISAGGGAFYFLTLPVVTGFPLNCQITITNVDDGGIGAARGKILSGFPVLPTGTILWPGQSITVKNLGAWKVVQYPDRWRLTANITFNVFPTPTGSDVNDGLALASPYATFQKCFDNIADWMDTAGFAVTCLSAPAQSYTNAGVTTYKTIVGQGNEIATVGGVITSCAVTIDGNGSTLNTNLTVADASFQIGSIKTGQGSTGVRFCVRRFTLTAAGNSSGIISNDGIIVALDGMTFGAMPGGVHMWSSGGGAQVLLINQSYTITGGAIAHAIAWANASMVIQGDTVTITGTPNFTSSFVTAQWGGQVYAAFSTFTGAATGARYYVDHGGILDTQNPSLTYFPGNAVAATSVNGWYDKYFQTIIISAGPSVPNAGPTGSMLWQGVANDSTVGYTLLDSANSQTAAFFRRANGTTAAPTALVLDNPIGGVQWLGHTGSGYTGSSKAYFQCYAAENWSATANGTYCDIGTTANTTTIVASRWRLHNSGGLSLGAGVLTTDPGTGGGYFENFISVGKAGGQTGAVNFLGATSGNVKLTVGAAAGTYNHVLPNSAGAAVSGSIANCYQSGGGGVTANLWGTCPASYVASTWTPTLIGSTSGSFTLATANGSYEQIGRQFTLRFTITTTANAAVGNIQIGGLPSASANVASDNGGCAITQMNGVTFDAGFTWLAGSIASNSSVVTLVENGSAVAVQALNTARFAAVVTLVGQCTYHN